MNAVRSGLVVVLLCICGVSTVTAQSRTTGKQPSTERRGSGILGSLFGTRTQEPASTNRNHGASNSSGGIFSRFTGSGKPNDDGRKVIEAVPRTEEPDWTGVPYHRPAPAAIAKSNQPLTDPNDPSNRNRSLPRPAATRPAATPATNAVAGSQTRGAQIPVPPSETVAPQSTKQIRSARVASRGPLYDVPTDELETNTFQPLSETDSSRRSRRRTVSPLEAGEVEPSFANSAPVPEAPAPSNQITAVTLLDTQPPAATQKLEEPKVARRTLPTQSTSRTIPPANASTLNSQAQPSPVSTPPSLATTPVAPVAKPVAKPESRTFDAPQTLQRNKSIGSTASQTQPIISPNATEGTAAENGTPNGWVSTNENVSRIPAGTSLSQSTPPSPSKPSSSVDTGVSPWQSDATATSVPEAQLNVRADNGVSSGQTSASAVAVNANANNVVGEIPGLRVITSGPAEIPVRQSIAYKVMIENRGTIDAPGAVVQIKLPNWVTIQGYQPTRGEVGREDDDTARHMLWMVEGLAANSREELVINLTAAEAREFDVHTEWAVMPQTSIAHVRVREPKLELVIEGPDQITYGESEIFKVRVLNPGNGPAESVVFTLSPNSATPQSQRIGIIPEGKEAQFEVELTAQDMEDLEIHGLAGGEFNIRAEQTKTIQVIRAELESMLSGPSIKYQDSEATFNLQVSNIGRAASKNINAVLQLPPGTRYLGGIENARQDGSRLTWLIDELPGSENVEYTIRCQMDQTGTQNFMFSCAGTAAGRTEVDFTTEVEALADLVLTINDPPAPAPVGTEVVYEIVVRNRGSKAAEQVVVLSQFGVDIEPIRIEGVEGEITPGQVKFAPIERLLPGQEIRLKVFAKAENEGHHRFCTEVRCGDTLLIAEEATRYMQTVGQRVSRRSGDK